MLFGRVYFGFCSPVGFVQFQLSSVCFDLVSLHWSALARLMIYSPNFVEIDSVLKNTGINIT